MVMKKNKKKLPVKGKNSLNLCWGHFPDKSTTDVCGRIEENSIYQINANVIDTFFNKFFVAAQIHKKVNKSLYLSTTHGEFDGHIIIFLKNQLERQKFLRVKLLFE